MSWALDQDWTLLKRTRDLSRAYEIGLREAPAAIYAETSYHVEEFLAGLLPALLQLCVVQALATAIGAGIGAGLGALVFGAGAIPGAAVGAEAGFDLGITILGWLGLAFLAAAIAHSLGDVVTLLKHAVVQAWRAADAHEDERRQQVRQAGQTLARAMAVLVRLILQGIVAWLLKRGIDKAPELIAELKASRLGVAFGEWVEKNLGRLVNDPKLRGHAGEGSTTKAAAESTAQTPSQLAGRQAEEAPPAVKPHRKLRFPVETKPNEAFFWSGRTNGVGGESVARQIAQGQSGTTLEALIEKRGIEMPKWDATDPSVVQAWKDISADYAAGASGTVRAVVGQSLRAGNVWESSELPALMSNPNVTKIITVDPASKVETVIFTR